MFVCLYVHTLCLYVCLFALLKSQENQSYHCCNGECEWLHCNYNGINHWLEKLYILLHFSFDCLVYACRCYSWNRRTPLLTNLKALFLHFSSNHSSILPSIHPFFRPSIHPSIHLLPPVAYLFNRQRQTWIRLLLFNLVLHHHVIHLYNSSSCHPSLQFIIMSSIFTIHHHVIHLYNSSSCHPSLQFITMSSIFTIHLHVIYLYNSSSSHFFTIHHQVIYL